MGDKLKNAKKWFRTSILENKYNYLAVIFTTLALIIILSTHDLHIENLTSVIGYLISASSIYASILFAYLLQKLSKLNTDKEKLLKNAKVMSSFKSLLHYRFLCYTSEGYIKQNLKNYTKIERLKITAFELVFVDIQMHENVTNDHFVEFEEYKTKEPLALDYAIIIKNSKIFTANIFRDSTYIDRTFYSNNSSINEFLNYLTSEGTFNRINLLNNANALK
mgnify:CR=1 FL=1